MSKPGMYENLTATGSLSAGTGATIKMAGVFCSTTASGTLVVTDAAGAAVTGTITLTAGTWYELPFEATGFTFTIANTANITVSYTK